MSNIAVLVRMLLELVLHAKSFNSGIGKVIKLQLISPNQ